MTFRNIKIYLCDSYEILNLQLLRLYVSVATIMFP